MDDARRDLAEDPWLASCDWIDGYPLLPPCLVLGAIGRGAMGAVYIARHLRLDLDVAVKCLRPEVASQSESWVKRFHREAGLAARISHQNLVRAHDVLSHRGLHYIVMEAVPGENLRQLVQRVGALPVQEAVAIVAQAASGLAAAHEAGVVHRDVKPDNVMVSVDGVVKLADLGLAKAVSPIPGTPHTTLHTTTMGTPQYMAPEQWEDTGSVGPAADVFGLAAVLWYLLAGRDPYPDAGMAELARRSAIEPFPDIGGVRRNVPPEVVQLLRISTAIDPARRPADGASFLRALRALPDQATLAELPGAVLSSWTIPGTPPSETLLQSAKAAISDADHGGCPSPAPAPRSSTLGGPQPPFAPGSDRSPSQAPGRRARRTLIPLAIALVALIAWVIATGLGPPPLPDRVVVQSMSTAAPTPRQQEILGLLKREVSVTWEAIPVRAALEDLERRAGVTIDLRLDSEGGEELLDGQDRPWLVATEGTATIDELLDHACAAAGWNVNWGLGTHGVVVGAGQELVEIRLYDISPWTLRGIDPEEILNLVRENVRTYDWDLNDEYNIDFYDVEVLVAIHNVRAHEEIESFLNRLLHRDDGLERAQILAQEAQRLEVMDEIRLRDVTVLSAARSLAADLGVGLRVIPSVGGDVLFTEAPLEYTANDLTVGELLKELSRASGLLWDLDEDWLVLSTDWRTTHFLVIYDVSDIPARWISVEPDTEPSIFRDFENSGDLLLTLIMDNIEPYSWTDDPEQSITQMPGWLLVRSPLDVQVQIRDLLDGIRAIHRR